MFTVEQYDNAIQALHDAKKQLVADGNPCSICGDGGHMAFECGHNPLLAMFICTQVAAHSHQLHETLHYLAGHDSRFGVQVGPAKVVVPDGGELCLCRPGELDPDCPKCGYDSMNGPLSKKASAGV